MRRNSQVLATTRPLREVAREARRCAVLRQADSEFRRVGVAAADLPAIARGVGISRANLYNYCEGREDLARQCYLDALKSFERALTEAREFPGQALDKVAAFVRAATGHDRPIAAIAAEIDLLSQAARLEIEQEQRSAFDALATMIHDGVLDGSIRACNAEVAARTIWGMISWTPLGAAWVAGADDNLAERMDASLPMLIERGIAESSINIDRAPVSGKWLAQIVASRPETRIEDIARIASSLFNRRGIEGVTLDDVATEMQATKGLLYHYLPNKAALVQHCFERAFEIYRGILDLAEERTDGIDQARYTVALNVQAQLHSLHPLSLATSYRQLAPAEQMAFTKATSELLDRSIAIARRGMRDRTCRDVDPAAVAFSAAGSFLFLGRWMPVQSTLDSIVVGSEVTDLYLYGLRSPRS